MKIGILSSLEQPSLEGRLRFLMPGVKRNAMPTSGFGWSAIRRKLPSVPGKKKAGPLRDRPVRSGESAGGSLHNAALELNST
jgi:hypothetical protein